MDSFEAKSICIFGRLPKLSLAEIESLYGSSHIHPIPQAALLDIDAFEINFKRLGGTVKVARVLALLPETQWGALEKYLIDNVPKHLQHVTEGTFTLGLSTYGFNVSAEDVNKTMMRLKKVVRGSGRSMRVVPNKAPDLNSAQVLHNKLTSRGAWELIFVRDGGQTILAQTIFVQDIDAYAARDQARPKRDARVGMLPPKLAQTMINLVNPPAGSIILDPFCGTGVVLQEALLMGYDVIGTDLDQRMIDYTKTNIDWLKTQKTDLAKNTLIEQADATLHKWPPGIEAVVSEIYLGTPFGKQPSKEDLQQSIHKVNVILKKFLSNISQQLVADKLLCLAVPAWRTKEGLLHLPILDKLADLGYNRRAFVHVGSEDLVYYRPDQVVARELLVLNRLKNNE